MPVSCASSAVVHGRCANASASPSRAATATLRRSAAVIERGALVAAGRRSNDLHAVLLGGGQERRVHPPAGSDDLRFPANHAREFGRFGVCKVRYGKSKRSSPYKPRSVLTVWRWTPPILEDWLANGRGEPDTLDLFPSERSGLISESTLLRRLRRYV